MMLSPIMQTNKGFRDVLPIVHVGLSKLHWIMTDVLGARRKHVGDIYWITFRLDTIIPNHVKTR